MTNCRAAQNSAPATVGDLMSQLRVSLVESYLRRGDWELARNTLEDLRENPVCGTQIASMESYPCAALLPTGYAVMMDRMIVEANQAATVRASTAGEVQRFTKLVETAAEYAERLRETAIDFLLQVSPEASEIRIGRRSKFQKIASAAETDGVFKFIGYSQKHGATYQWTDFGLDVRARLS